MKKFIILILILIATTELYSQGVRWVREKHHLIGGIGGAGFMGDLGGANAIGSQGIRDFEFPAVRPSFMLGYRYRLFNNLAFTGNFTMGYISGDDNHTEEPYRNNRNIHFRSPIYELAATTQFYLFNYEMQGAYYRRVSRTALRIFAIDAYIFAGIGGFYYNPQAFFDASEYTGTVAAADLPSNGWYNLRSLNTEGQGYFQTREQYSPMSMVIPFGLGANVQIHRDFTVGLQLGFRKTFTDYLDDVSTTYVDPTIFSEIFENPADRALAEHFSNPTNNTLSKNITQPGQQRGNPYNTDTYMFGLITVYYRIPDLFRPSGVIRF
ncbi:MAG: DUF6089 family protein [Bacteroidota bacterium]